MRPSHRRPSPAFAGFEHETALWAAGLNRIAGVDEAGRGPLAGPVSAAAVILDPARPIPGLADSKKLSAHRREALFLEIFDKAEVAFSLSPAADIDRLNIRQASLAAMRRAVAGLAVAADFAVVDGRDIPAGLPCPARAIIGGDAVSASIAAASIIAKVMRDRLMARAGAAFPGYGFDKGFGYPTPAHRAALAALGPSALHRMSFAPCKNGTPAAGEA